MEVIESDVSFSYPPLADPARQIRLLRFTEEVVVDRRTYMKYESFAEHLDSSLEYVAISYTWGDPKRMRAILIDNALFLVRENCWLALWQTVKACKNRCIWIDSICIDQNNDTEKSLQVALMGAIYKQAAQVNVCIGEHADGSHIVLQHARRYTDWIRDMYEQRTSDDISETLDTFMKIHQDDIKAPFAGGTPLQLEHAQHLMRKLSEREYFKRLWIVQELYLARSRVLFCGDYVLPFQDLVIYHLGLSGYCRAAIQLPQSHPHAELPHQAPTVEFESLVNSLDDWEGMNLITLLEQLSLAKCSDVRDRVYGLLAIASWHDSHRLLPDYTKSSWEIAHEICTYLATLCSARHDNKLTTDEVHVVAKSMGLLNEGLLGLGIDHQTEHLQTLLNARRSLAFRRSAGSWHDSHVQTPMVDIRPCQVFPLFYSDHDFPTLSACLVEMEEDDDPYYMMRLSLERTQILDAFRYAVEQEEVPHQLVVCPGRTVALVPLETQAGDLLLSFQEQQVMSGLVIRKPQDECPFYRIIGQALINAEMLPCTDDDRCRCGDNRRHHADVECQIYVRFNTEDFLLFLQQDVEYDEGRSLVVNAKEAVRRLVTSVTHPDDPYSSYIAVSSETQEQSICSEKHHVCQERVRDRLARSRSR